MKYLFSEKASEAVKYFPTMLSVVATLSIVLGKDIDVEIYADPSPERTIHEMVINSTVAKVRLKPENMHHPINPRTSHLAALYLIKTLEELDEEICIGI